ncbi:MAG: recombinase family protein, partial [Oscillospiraceae bacterium]|nr:recombinase family protein [Oscillospiraceae bacterium]
VLQLLSFVAQNEREQIRSRQAAGIEEAKKRGVRFGRPKTPLPPNFSALSRAFRMGQLTLSQVLDETRLPRSTFYQKLREYEQAEKQIS